MRPHPGVNDAAPTDAYFRAQVVDGELWLSTASSDGRLGDCAARRRGYVRARCVAARRRPPPTSEVEDEPAPSSIVETVTRRFETFGYPFVYDDNLIPDDDTTLFVCSGMQRVKDSFHRPDGGRHGSLQSCLRTNDLDLVGDGTHLTFFQMVGNFSFGGNDYETSVELWHSILADLRVRVDTVHVHPERDDHRALWLRRGYHTVPDPTCEWSDGAVRGHCCELYVGSLEIGNLVNPLGHSTDVGFGWERLHQVVERVDRVERTSLFVPGLHPVVADHVRAIEALLRNGVRPGNKGRAYVCRRILRRLIRLDDGATRYGFDDVVREERASLERRLRSARRVYHRYRSQPPSFWWETYGILPEELPLLAG